MPDAGSEAPGGPATRGGSFMSDEILSTLDDIPPMGAVAVSVMRMVEDDRYSAADLARVISRDPGLTSKVMRTSNSAFFGLGQPVTSLSQAVVVLGLRMVRNLVLIHSLPVGRSGGGRMTEIETRMWTHSVGSALGSRLLAQRTGRVDPEQAFLGGLFHDIGRLLFNQVRPLTYQTLARRSADGLPDRAAERKHLGMDHALLGSAALERWKMGDELAAAVRDHHRSPELLGPLALTVQGAEEILAGIGIGEGDQDGREEAEQDPGDAQKGCRALRLLGLEEGMEEIEERLQATLKQEQAFFRQAA